MSAALQGELQSKKIFQTQYNLSPVSSLSLQLLSCSEPPLSPFLLQLLSGHTPGLPAHHRLHFLGHNEALQDETLPSGIFIMAKKKLTSGILRLNKDLRQQQPTGLQQYHLEK